MNDEMSKDHKDPKIEEKNGSHAFTKPLIVAIIGTFVGTVLATLATLWYFQFPIANTSEHQRIMSEEQKLMAELKGLWTYELENRVTGDYILGAFEMREKDGKLFVPSGRSYYSAKKNGMFLDRGKWESKAVAIGNKTVYIIYIMKATRNKRESGIASYYKGIAELTIMSTNSLEGTYHNIGEEHNNWGYILRMEKSIKDNINDAIKEAKEKYGI